MPNVIRVGMGEIAVAQAPGELVALGLGSCIGICMYDPQLKLGGLAHIMLPDSTIAKTPQNPAKFADTAIPNLINEMIKQGAALDRLVVKIAGGAQMFSSANSHQSQESIGRRNIAAVEQILSSFGLKPAAKSIGGNAGKSLSLDLETGELYIRSVQVESLKL